MVALHLVSRHQSMSALDTHKEGSSVKRFFFAVLMLLLVSPSLAASAQEPVDIDAIAEQLASVDSEQLLMALNTPIPDELLSGPFSGARPMSPDLLAQQRVTFTEALESKTGSAIYTVTYAPEYATTSASPEVTASPMASPEGRAPQAFFVGSTLTYIIIAEPVDTSDMASFGTSMQNAMGSEAQHGTVEEITVSDAPAVLISTVATVNAVEIHTQWIAVPVGNVVVVGMVMIGIEGFDEDAFRADNESLVLSGIAYLQTIVTA
jgi:hypothetical protein